jgi:hypothetical protein
MKRSLPFISGALLSFIAVTGGYQALAATDPQALPLPATQPVPAPTTWAAPIPSTLSTPPKAVTPPPANHDSKIIPQNNVTPRRNHRPDQQQPISPPPIY